MYTVLRTLATHEKAVGAASAEQSELNVEAFCFHKDKDMQDMKYCTECCTVFFKKYGDFCPVCKSTGTIERIIEQEPASAEHPIPVGGPDAKDFTSDENGLPSFPHMDPNCDCYKCWQVWRLRKAARPLHIK